MTRTTEPDRVYTIDALLAEGFSRVQIYNLRKTGLLPKAHGRGISAYYTDAHLTILRAVKRARDERTNLTDIAERFGREFKGYP